MTDIGWPILCVEFVMAPDAGLDKSIQYPKTTKCNFVTPKDKKDRK